MPEMRVQAAFLIANVNPKLFSVGVLIFIGIPLAIALVRKELKRSTVRMAVVLLILCPVVYAVTDRMDSEFERLRDVYFLVTGSMIVFVFAAWLTSAISTQNWKPVVGAAWGLVFSVLAELIVLYAALYFE